MNHSFARLIDGMAATLHQEIIPHIGTEFARGQAFGVVYMLNSLRLRAGWSSEFFVAQLAMQTELRAALEPLVAGLDTPLLPEAGTSSRTAAELQAVFEVGQGRVCALLEWLAQVRDRLPRARIEAIDAVLRRYMSQQLKWELSTSARPMFAEISSGAE
jgi:hypothetical protein